MEHRRDIKAHMLPYPLQLTQLLQNMSVHHLTTFPVHIRSHQVKPTKMLERKNAPKAMRMKTNVKILK